MSLAHIGLLNARSMYFLFHSPFLNKCSGIGKKKKVNKGLLELEHLFCHFSPSGDQLYVYAKTTQAILHSNAY